MKKRNIILLIVLSLILSSCSNVSNTSQYESKITSLENKNKLLSEEVAELKNDNDNLKNMVEELENDNKQLGNEINSLKEALQESTEKEIFIVNEEPEQTEKLLEQLQEVNLSKFKDNQGYKISAGKPVSGYNLATFTRKEYTVPDELGENEFAYVVKIEALNESNTKTLYKNYLSLYYKASKNDSVFFLHIESHSSLSPESKVSDAEEKRIKQINQLLEQTFEPALVEHFSLPSLDFNNHEYSFDNGKMEKVYISGGGFEAFQYIFIAE